MIFGIPPEPPVRYGRSAELAAIMAAARPAPGGRTAAAVVVHGPSGGGKSALVVRAGHRLAEAFPDGQIFLTAEGAEPAAADLLGRALHALGVPAGALPAGFDELTDRYQAIVAVRRVLVILDGPGTAEQVRPLVPLPPGATELPRSALLVAARSALPGLTGVRRVEVRPSDPR
ncbi:AAA family ATPase [Micromonosporaceae bacterium Da 78-11]